MQERAVGTPQNVTHDASLDAPVVIPAVELSGSQSDRLRALDVSIVRLQRLKRALAGDMPPHEPPLELHGPYLYAPVWPWFLAGWIIGALFVLMFVFARALA
jgi:hypothetical protein